MKISWLLDKPVDLWQSYIKDCYNNYKKLYGNIRIDLLSGENIFGNRLPNKIKSRYFSKFYSLTYYKNYANYIWMKKHKVDIIHLQRSYLFPSILELLKIKKRPKIIITLRGSDTYLWPWLKKNWSSFYNNEGKNIDAYIVQSIDQKKYTQNLGIDLNKVFIIPASLKKIECLPKNIKYDKTLKIISVFRFTWQKNIQGNLLFIKKLKDIYPNLKYTIYGYGDNLHRSQILYIADRFKILDIIDIKDRIPNIEMKKVYKKFNFLLQLSISESLGVTILEAMQQGLIPITSNTGGIKDIVRNGHTGISEKYYEIDKLILSFIKVYQSFQKYEEISKNCINFINQNYENDLECQKLNTLYNNILK